MALVLALALQAAAFSASAPLPITFDLAKHKPADRGRACAPDFASEIVVCGRRRGGGDYPLEEMALLFEAKPLIAEKSLGHGATGRAYLESATMANGQVSNRVMAGVKLGF